MYSKFTPVTKQLIIDYVTLGIDLEDVLSALNIEMKLYKAYCNEDKKFYDDVSMALIAPRLSALDVVKNAITQRSLEDSAKAAQWYLDYELKKKKVNKEVSSENTDKEIKIIISREG